MHLPHVCPLPRGYLRHVLTVGEPTAWRLLSLHNLSFVLAFMDQIRDAVATGTLARLRERTAEVWDGAAGERL